MKLGKNRIFKVLETLMDTIVANTYWKFYIICSKVLIYSVKECLILQRKIDSLCEITKNNLVYQPGREETRVCKAFCYSIMWRVTHRILEFHTYHLTNIDAVCKLSYFIHYIKDKYIHNTVSAYWHCPLMP